MNTTEKLDRLAELDAYRDTIWVDKEALKQQIIPAEVKQQLRDIDEEYDSKRDAILQERSQLELEVRDAVMVAGESVKGAKLIQMLINICQPKRQTMNYLENGFDDIYAFLMKTGE